LCYFFFFLVFFGGGPPPPPTKIPLYPRPLGHLRRQKRLNAIALTILRVYYPSGEPLQFAAFLYFGVRVL
jgi:hypothetical protein